MMLPGSPHAGDLFLSWFIRLAIQGVDIVSLNWMLGAPRSGVNPLPPRSRVGTRTSGDGLYGRGCKGWAYPFPWFENYRNSMHSAETKIRRLRPGVGT